MRSPSTEPSPPALRHTAAMHTDDVDRPAQVHMHTLDEVAARWSDPGSAGGRGWMAYHARLPMGEQTSPPPLERKNSTDDSQTSSPLECDCRAAGDAACPRRDCRGERHVSWAPDDTLCAVREYEIESEEEGLDKEWRLAFTQRTRRHRKEMASGSAEVSLRPYGSSGAQLTGMNALMCDEELADEEEEDVEEDTDEDEEIEVEDEKHTQEEAGDGSRRRLGHGRIEMDVHPIFHAKHDASMSPRRPLIKLQYSPSGRPVPLRSAMKKTLRHTPPSLTSKYAAWPVSLGTFRTSRSPVRAGLLPFPRTSQHLIGRPSLPGTSYRRSYPSRGQRMRRMLLEGAVRHDH